MRKIVQANGVDLCVETFGYTAEIPPRTTWGVLVPAILDHTGAR